MDAYHIVSRLWLYSNGIHVAMLNSLCDSHHASPPQLDSLALLIVKTMNGKSASSLTPSGSTIRMLRRADLYELRDLQGVLRPQTFAFHSD